MSEPERWYSAQETHLARFLSLNLASGDEATVMYHGLRYFVRFDAVGLPMRVEREMKCPSGPMARRRVWERGQAKLPATLAVLKMVKGYRDPHVSGGAVGNGP
jgi:hypothetical protein